MILASYLVNSKIHYLSWRLYFWTDLEYQCINGKLLMIRIHWWFDDNRARTRTWIMAWFIKRPNHVIRPHGINSHQKVLILIWTQRWYLEEDIPGSMRSVAFVELEIYWFMCASHNKQGANATQDNSDHYCVGLRWHPVCYD